MSILIKIQHKILLNCGVIKEHYVVYKATGGITHMLMGLAECIDYAESNHYFLIIDCKTAPEFGVKFKDMFYLKNIHYSEDYNILSRKIIGTLPSEFPLARAKYIHQELPIIAETHYQIMSNPIFIAELNRFSIINNNEKIECYAGNGNKSLDHYFPIILKYLLIQKEIMQKILENKIRKPYVGVHFINNKKKNSIDLIYQEVIKILTENEYLNLIYLATDDKYSIEKFKEFLMQFNQQTKREISLKHQTGMPYNSGDVLYAIRERVLKEKWGMSKLDLQIKILEDIYLLYHSTFFVPSIGSGYSDLVNVMRKAGDCFIK